MDKVFLRKLFYESIAVIIGLFISLYPAPMNLGQSAMWVLGLLAWAIINWMTNVIPDFVCIFVMCSGWVLLGIMSFPTAFGSFLAQQFGSSFLPWV